MEFSWYIVWNVLITFVIFPIWNSIRKNETEIQRLNILINKTREEIARDYVTRSSFNIEFERVLDKLDKLDAKIDKLITN
tara:strand:- start:1973 stop:2212 length:240 start_codon:yes stop_codon:yes gene_type:complete